MSNPMTDQLVFGFRKVYREWFKELSDGFPEQKRMIVRYYKEHMDRPEDILRLFGESFQPYIDRIGDRDMTFFDDCAEFYTPIGYQELVRSEPGQRKEFRDSQMNRLVQLGYTYLLLEEARKPKGEDDEIPTLPEPDARLLKYMSALSVGTDWMKHFAEMTGGAHAVSPTEEEARQAESHANEFFQSNPFLAEIAESLAKDIEIPEEMKNIQNPMDVFAHIMSPTGKDFMENMVKKVGDRIHQKIESGELSEAQLVEQAQRMMGTFFGQGNPLASFMGGMARGPAPAASASTSTATPQQSDAERKAELRRKLHEKLKEKRRK